MGEGPLIIKYVDINPQKTEVYADGYRGRIEFYGTLESYEGIPNFTWRSYKFQGHDQSEMDGVDITFTDRSPIEFVKTDKIFSEVPQSGNLIFLHADIDGNVSVYHFDSSRERDNSFQFDVKKGEFFCWICLPGQVEAAEVLEFEKPGFTDQDLAVITKPNTFEVEFEGNTNKVPLKFQQMMNKIQSGNLENSIIPILELDSI